MPKGTSGYGRAKVRVPRWGDALAVEQPWCRPASWRRLAKLLGGRWLTAGELCAVMQRLAPHELHPRRVGRVLTKWLQRRPANIPAALGEVQVRPPVTVENKISARGATYRISRPGESYDDDAAFPGEEEFDDILSECLTLKDVAELRRMLAEGAPDDTLREAQERA